MNLLSDDFHFDEAEDADVDVDAVDGERFADSADETGDAATEGTAYRTTAIVGVGANGVAALSRLRLPGRGVHISG